MYLMRDLVSPGVLVLFMAAAACGERHKGEGDANVDEDALQDADDAGGDGGSEIVPGCGNGIVEGDEECDDGDANSDTEPDACRTDCREHRCGDGVVDTDEQCDDANEVQDDGCRIDCSEPQAMPTVGMDREEVDLLVWGGTNESLSAGGSIVVDLNKDGYDDLVMSARWPGRAHVLFGGPHLGGTIFDVVGEYGEPVDMTFTGPEMYFPKTMAAGDFDGDGEIDLALGASDFSAHTGIIYVFLGPLVTGRDVSEADVAIHNLADLGTDMATGKLDGDDADDLVIGIEYLSYDDGSMVREGAGVALVVSGGPEVFSTGRSFDLFPDGFDAMLVGADHWAAFGTRLAVSDVDGDGIQDVLASAPSISRGMSRPQVGEVDLFHGPLRRIAGEPEIRDPASGGADLRVMGTLPHQRMGSWGLELADVNGDDFRDIVIGSPNTARIDKGQIDVIAGRRFSSEAIDLDTDEPMLHVLSSTPSGLGNGLAAGDIDGDARADLLMGVEFVYMAWWGGYGGVFIHGGRSSYPTGYRVDIVGPEGDDGPDALLMGLSHGFGTSLRSGDINGDGYDEIVASHCRVEEGPFSERTVPGVICVFFGGPGYLPPPGCWNDLDDDGDGATDVDDPGCSHPIDEDEVEHVWPCDDGSDNDGDTLVDWPSDPGCRLPQDSGETDPSTGPPACSDGSDNDGDGDADWPADPGCRCAADTGEEQGHVVLVGHDYSYPWPLDVRYVLGNAVLAFADPSDDPVEVLGFTQWTDTGVVANVELSVDQRATALGRSWNLTEATDYSAVTASLSPEAFDVLLVYPQMPGASLSSIDLGEWWAWVLLDFVDQGGTAVFIHDSANVLEGAQMIDVYTFGIMSEELDVIDFSSPLAGGLAASFTAPSDTVVYLLPAVSASDVVMARDSFEPFALVVAW